MSVDNDCESVITSGVKINLISPNPAQNKAVMGIELTKNTETKIELYNRIGIKVASVFSGEKSMGKHKLEINTSSLYSGVISLRNA